MHRIDFIVSPQKAILYFHFYLFIFFCFLLFVIAFTAAISSRYNNKNNAGKSMSSTQLLTLHNNSSSNRNQNNNCWLGFSCFLMPHCHHICCHYLDICIVCIYVHMAIHISHCKCRANNCCQREWVKKGGDRNGETRVGSLGINETGNALG